MTSKEILNRLIDLKDSGAVMDYLIETDFSVRDGQKFVKTRLTIFNSTGKPQVTTGLVESKVEEDNITNLQDRSIEIAWEQNPIIN